MKFEAMAETKLLNFNGDKSCLIILAPKKKKEEVENLLKVDPIMLDNKPMKVANNVKYLGETISGSVADSIEATIKKRKGQAMIAINEITNLVNDTRSKSIGGIEVAIKVFELAIIPYLLNNTGT